MHPKKGPSRSDWSDLISKIDWVSGADATFGRDRLYQTPQDTDGISESCIDIKSLSGINERVTRVRRHQVLDMWETWVRDR